ncbi:hypothetical protein B4113_0612 [Geobacillus sp. B4113_201601]|nr:hypothetical protein B4113_0612 [Geobacillus sp. B4113_201601]
MYVHLSYDTLSPTRNEIATILPVCSQTVHERHRLTTTGGNSGLVHKRPFTGSFPQTIAGHEKSRPSNGRLFSADPVRRKPGKRRYA